MQKMRFIENLFFKHQIYSALQHDLRFPYHNRSDSGEVSKRPQLHQCQSTSTRRKIDNGKLDLKRALRGGNRRTLAQGMLGDIWRWVLNDQSSHHLSLPVPLFVCLSICLSFCSHACLLHRQVQPKYHLTRLTFASMPRVITVYLSCFYLCLCLCLLPVWATLSAKLASSCRHRHIDWLSFLAFIIPSKAKGNKKQEKTRKN